MRLLTRCLPPNMTEEKGKVGSTCCATGTVGLARICEMAVKFCLNRLSGERALVKYSYLHFLLTKLSFCASNEPPAVLGQIRLREWGN